MLDFVASLVSFIVMPNVVQVHDRCAPALVHSFLLTHSLTHSLPQDTLTVIDNSALLASSAFLTPFSEVFAFMEHVLLVRISYAVGSGCVCVCVCV